METVNVEFCLKKTDIVSHPAHDEEVGKYIMTFKIVNF